MSLGRRFAPGLLFGLALVAALVPLSAAAHPWTQVATGERGDYRWSVSLGGHQGAPGARAAASHGPCLLVAGSWRSGPLEWHRSSFRECASAPLRGATAPLVATTAQTSGSDPEQISVVGMALAADVRRVRVTLGGGRHVAVIPRRAAPRPGRGPGSPLRYAAFTVRGEWCAERIVSLAAAGVVLWDSGSDEYQCGANVPPTFTASPAS